MKSEPRRDSRGRNVETKDIGQTPVRKMRPYRDTIRVIATRHPDLVKEKQADIEDIAILGENWTRCEVADA